MVGQSGGPTSAINATLAGVIDGAIESGEYEHVYGAVNGIEGLLSKRIVELEKTFNSDEMIKSLVRTPAMYLGSCRYKLPSLDVSSEQYERVFNIFEEYSITDFFYIGGNDSMDTAMKLSAYARKIGYDIHIIGVPKTIDNDLFGTDHTPGFGSAAKFAATSMREIVYDSMIYNKKSVTIVEIMGRNAGWLTAATALARMDGLRAPHLVYLPEVPFDKDKFIDSINELFKTQRNIIVAVSEGVKDTNGNYLDHENLNEDEFGNVLHSGTGKVLEQLVLCKIGCKVRSVELNVLQRCAMHIASKTDLDESFNVGKAAVNAALAGNSDVMMCLKRVRGGDVYKCAVEYENIESVANFEKTVPLEWISESGDDIKQPLYDYIKPLIQGEVTVSYDDGLPSYLDVSHLL